MHRVADTLALTSGGSPRRVPSSTHWSPRPPHRPDTPPPARLDGTSASRAVPPRRWLQLATADLQRDTHDLTVEQELAALEKRMIEWTQKRRMEVQEAASWTAENGAAHVAAAMETRLQRRQEAERVRAQQRLHRLLETLESRLSHYTQGVSLISDSEHPSEARSVFAAAAIAHSAPSSLPSESSPTSELAACERHHLIGCQQLFLEEREARSQLESRYQFAVEVALLKAFEVESRTCVEEWEEMSHNRLSVHTVSPAH